MEAVFFLALTIFLTVLAPLIIIFHFITKWKQTREISREDEGMLEELWALSQALEDRIETLERILDDEPHSQRRQ
jgi:phage shock protein B